MLSSSARRAWRAAAALRPLLALAALLAVLLVGRGDALAAPPDDWTVRDAGPLSLALPPTWLTFSLDQRDFEARAEQIAADNPALAGVTEMMIRTRAFEQYQFLAFDSAATGEFAANVNVLSLALPGAVRSDEIATVIATELPRQVAGISIERTVAGLDVNGRDAALVSYSYPFVAASGRTITIAGRQFYVIAGARLYIVTVTGTASDAFGALAEQIGMTFVVA